MENSCISCGVECNKILSRREFIICDTCHDGCITREKETVWQLKFQKADKITENIYLGGASSIIEYEYLKENNINRILTAAIYCEDHQLFKESRYQIEYKTLEIDDDPKQNIRQFFEEAFEFIEKDSDKNILIHCASGISRSGTIVIAYLMKTKNLTFKEALEQVRLKRKQVHPNSGFKKQLMEYEQELKKEKEEKEKEK